jgi:formate hydrogenlyase subunit 3/multisubunit Na+/H+ antiporter MnhD subunit
MRRVGLVLLAIGIAGFLCASYERGLYERTEGTPGAPPASERRAREAWEDARWHLVGTAVIGIVFTVLPGRRE